MSLYRKTGYLLNFQTKKLPIPTYFYYFFLFKSVIIRFRFKANIETNPQVMLCCSCLLLWFLYQSALRIAMWTGLHIPTCLLNSNSSPFFLLPRVILEFSLETNCILVGFAYSISFSKYATSPITVSIFIPVTLLFLD